MLHFRRSISRLAGTLFAFALATAALHGQTSHSIHDVMTNLPNSPLLGQNVILDQGTPIVVGVVPGAASGSNGGFYLTLASWDSDVNTSEGIFVAGSSIAGCQVSVGQVVKVTGVVTNSTTPYVTAANTPGTYIVPSACTSSGTAAMSEGISLSSSLTTFGDALKYTGMAVTNPSFYAVQPTTGTLATGANTVVSTGQFWATLGSNSTTSNHLFRSAGIAGDEYKPGSAPAGVATWGGNPQRVLIDTATFGGTAVDITVGQTITCTNTGASVGSTRGIGVVDYTLGYARILIFKNVTCAVSGTVPVTNNAVADSTHFKVGTLDVNTFLGEGGTQIVALALSKATTVVTSVFGSPDIFALQQVGDQSTLQLLADNANAANSAATAYTATVLGTDTVNSGFLINNDTVKNTHFAEAGRGATYTTASGASATLWEHPPLVMTGEFVRTGKNYPITVIDAYLTPRDNIGDATLGADVRAHRAAQASALSALVQQYQTAGANVIVAGNFNSYEYNDGYVDVMGVVKGSPAAVTAVTLYQATSTTQALTDFTTSVSVNSRYNIIERGNAASLEHILASSAVTDSTTASGSLASYINVVTQPHFTTDYAAVSANSNSTPAGLTPHDGFLVNFAIPPVPTTATLTPTALNFGDVSLGGTRTLSLTFTNTSSFSPAQIDIANIAIGGTNAGDFTQTSTCTAVTQNQTCTVSVTFAPTAAGTRTGTLTVTSDSTSNPILTASLTGNGIDTTATLTPTSATFPDTYAGGGVSAAQTFTVTNTSQVAITLKSFATTGGFKISANACGTTLAASATCTVQVQFAPTTSGAQTGTLVVTTSTSANPTLTATLSGNGLATTATLTPTSASFGNVVLGDTSGAVTFTWTNTSAIALTVTGANATGDYRVASNGCSSVAAGASCTVTVVFAPTVLGTRTGTLTVTSTSSANPTLTAALTGRGVADVEATPVSLNFGNIDVGQRSAAQTVTVTNYTSASIGLTGITLSGDSYAQAATCGSVLAGHGTCTITVVFAPASVGTKTGALVVTTNDTKYPVLTVALTGNGVDFAVAIDPASDNQIAGAGTMTPTLTVTPLGGFNAAIAMSCSTTANASTCTVPTTSTTLSATLAQKLAITTTSQYTVVGYGIPGLWRGRGLLAALLGMAASALLFASRRRCAMPARLLLAFMALLLTSAGLTGCSGKIPDQREAYTSAGTWVYTVTVTDGTLTHTAAYTLNVRAK